MKAAVLYVPVIHAGHLELCRRQRPDALFVVGKSLISEFSNLERDIRALDPELVIREALAISLAEDVFILEKGDLPELSKFNEIILSNDEVGRSLREKYLKDKKIIWDTTFLRWNKMNAVTHSPVNTDTKISIKEFDKKLIQLVYKEAEKSSDWWRHVGAALVKEGKVVYTLYNKHAITENTSYIEGEPRSNFDAGKAIADMVIFQHGEAAIIAQAARDGIVTKEAEIYVTTFPCPSCAMSIANAGIAKVYYKEGYSLLDAERILRDAGVELIRVE